MNKGLIKILKRFRVKFHPVVWNGDRPIIYVLALLILFAIIGLFSKICYLIIFSILFFFRDPNRFIIHNEHEYVLAPSDGVIMSITEEGNMCIVVIFLSIFDVHINRIPVTGQVKRIEYQPGHFNYAFDDKASTNERCTVYIQLPNGTDEVQVTQIAGYIARRIETDLHAVDQAVRAGDKYGIICFSSSMELRFPKAYKLHIREMQRVRAGESIIASIV